PGKNYWQNRADYSINVEIDPQTRLLSGTEKMAYYNNSPDTLRELVIHLFPNIYKKGNPREEKIYPFDENEGVVIEEIFVNDTKLHDPSHEKYTDYIEEDYNLIIFQQLPPGGQISIKISWHFTINRYSHVRTGAVDSSSFFIAYFFPRMAVYDDIDGWNEFEYTGTSEFYNDFGSFEVAVTVPKNFVVWATGMLQNPEEVLSKKYLNRYKTALTSDSIIHIIDSTECIKKNITKQKGKSTWKFKADNITDFAFGTSDHYLWDASSLEVDKITGRRVLIDAAYDRNSNDFYKVAALARKAIAFMSFQFPGVPFPFPQETVFNGLSEMEYPMMVNDYSTNDPHYLIKLTTHEIFHSYFPFYTGLNETKYAWMDEGLTSYGEYVTVYHLDSPEQANFYFYKSYKRYIGHDFDFPIFATSDYIKPPLYDFNSYVKPAVFFMILHDQLGDKLFKKALQEFITRWHGKHPMPFDLFFTFMDVNGQNLDWLIKPWFFEYGYMDLAVYKIIKEEGKYKVIIEKKGHYPGPVKLKITFDDNSIKIFEKKASIWENGENYYPIQISTDKKIKQVELINKYYLDADLTNNVLKL
ncbi:MAG: M1 family metallopeptidase, partial [Calditrichia bacterium]|nr:M1 family metallopeptidase [Calditrichia bacterium]